MYQINGILKLSEQDDFESGCVGQGVDMHIDASFRDATIDGVIAKFANFVGVEVADVQRNVCEEDGRIEGARTEDEEGFELSEKQVQQWKAGKCKAWYATYTGYVYKCEPVAV